MAALAARRGRQAVPVQEGVGAALAAVAVVAQLPVMLDLAAMEAVTAREVVEVAHPLMTLETLAQAATAHPVTL